MDICLWPTGSSRTKHVGFWRSAGTREEIWANPRAVARSGYRLARRGAAFTLRPIVELPAADVMFQSRPTFIGPDMVESLYS